MIVSDLFLRGAWALSLSPFVLSATGVDSFLYSMMTAYLELFRRCMSNIFKAGNEHVKNCKELQVTIRDSAILGEVKAYVEEVKAKKPEQ